MKIMKFGGTSVGKPERMRQVSELITQDEEAKIVVLSALSGTTNALVGIGNGMKEWNSRFESILFHFTLRVARYENLFFTLNRLRTSEAFDPTIHMHLEV